MLAPRVRLALVALIATQVMPLSSCSSSTCTTGPVLSDEVHIDLSGIAETSQNLIGDICLNEDCQSFRLSGPEYVVDTAPGSGSFEESVQVVRVTAQSAGRAIFAAEIEAVPVRVARLPDPSTKCTQDVAVINLRAAGSRTLEVVPPS